MNSDEIKQKVLEVSGFKEFNPVQRLALEKGLLEGKNLVVVSPTASGKTIIAEIAGLKKVVEEKKKMVYLCPLVSLANEKYNTFLKKYRNLGIKIALSVGDLDSADPWLQKYDWIIASNEKMDSLLRHGAPWLEEVGVIVVDEIHLINDVSRGPVLEVLLTRLMEVLPKAQVIALSATIANARDVAEWLNAELVVSDWRPVKLYEGVAYDSKIRFLEKNDRQLDDRLPLEDGITKDTLMMHKQALFFTATRRNCESLAERLGRVVKNFIGKSEKDLLDKLADEIENVLEVPTKQCKKLAKCVKNGVAFHHSGLLHKQRVLIEENFRKGLIKVIVATPTLAMGVNLPSFRVIVRDVKRYYPGVGAVYLPVLEVHQMFGRAGRPAYDKEGEAILIAKSEDEAEELEERYILGEPEEIYSKLAMEPVLRMQILALVSTSFVRSTESLLKFFSKTFYAYQYNDTTLLNSKIQDVLEKLIEWKFVVLDGGRLKPTKIGKRISELYIDPLTGYQFIEGLNETEKKKLTPLSFLQLIANTLEMRPLLSVKVGEFEELNEFIALHEDEFLRRVPEDWELEFDDFIASVKTALMLNDWMNEATEEEILEKYRVTPGELRGKLTNADWLLYALHEIALLLGKKDLLSMIRKIRLRIQYGVKEELLRLVKLKGIGRVRARKLYNVGFKTLKSLKEAPLETLAKIVGPKVAINIKEQLDEKVEKPKEEKQTTLFD